MMIQSVRAIDIHSHLNHGSRFDAKSGGRLDSADLDYLREMYRAANIETAFLSTFASVISAEDVTEENRYLTDLVRREKNIFQWVVVEPRNEESFRQAEELLGTEKCVGVKLHPPYHKYSFAEYGDRIFSRLAEHSPIVLIHPEKEADYILPFADRYPSITFIMAHMGSFGDEDCYANAIRRAKHGNVWVDTSGMASMHNRVVEYTVGLVGSEHILFGTDTYASGFQRGRIEYALISEEDKRNILRDNALRLFGRWLSFAERSE